MTDRYENIRKALAMGPTQGKWYWSDAYPTQDGRKTWSLIGDGGFGILSCDGDENSPQSVDAAAAELIAACDPDTIRALLEERDVLAATLAAIEAARDGYRDDAHQMHAALVRMVAQYESEFDHEDTHKFRPEWLREALALTNALQEGGEGLEIEPETLDAPSTWR